MADETLLVYEAEFEASEEFPPRRFTRFAHLVEFAESVVESEFWDDHWPNAPTHLIIERRSRNATESLGGRQGDTATVWMVDSHHWDVISVLHELAHVAVQVDHESGEHGETFRATLLQLVRRFVGVEAYASLQGAFKRRGL